jgi:hypothetical protein
MQGSVSSRAHLMCQFSFTDLGIFITELKIKKHDYVSTGCSFIDVQHGHKQGNRGTVGLNKRTTQGQCYFPPDKLGGTSDSAVGFKTLTPSSYKSSAPCATPETFPCAVYNE